MCKYMFEIVHSFLSTWGAASLEKQQQQQQQQQQNVKIFKQYADMHRFWKESFNLAFLPQVDSYNVIQYILPM